MIMQSGRFSGGGGGGSNRDVVFTARVDTKDARKELSAFAKDVESVQKQLGNMRMGAGGGLAGSANPAARGRVGGSPSVLLSDSAFERQQRSFFDRALREEDRAVKKTLGDRAKDLKNLKKDTKDAMEGVIGLTRAFVLLGVSSEENLEKAIRTLAKFEAAVAGYKGGVKLAEGLGGLLGRAAPRLGMAAGAGATGLGAAGIAAGAGVLTGGAAIYDQINYSRTGRIGAFSQGYSDTATGLAGWAKGWGLDPRKATFGGAMANLSPILQLSRLSGGYEASDSNDRARSGMRGALDAQGNMVQESQKRLAIERDILAIMEREAETIKRASEAAKDRRTSAAMGFASLSPWDQRGVSQLRNRFLNDPSKLSNRELMAVMPYVGQNEQSRIQERIRGRMPAEFTNRGFQEERTAEMRDQWSEKGAIQVQRELVLNLTIDNSQAIKDLENLVEKALDGADKQLEAAVAEMEKRLNDFNRQMEQNRQLGIGAQSSAFGSGF